MKKIKTRRFKKNLVYKILSFLLILSSLAFLGVLFYLDLLPIKYSIILLLIVVLFDVLNIFLVNLKKLNRKIKKGLSVFIIIIIILMTIANFYMGKTLGVLLTNGDSKYKLENYSVIVLKDSKFDTLKDIKGESLGYYQNSTGSEIANSYLSENIDVNLNNYESSDSLVQDLLNSKINAILIEDSIRELMEEELSDFANSYKVIYSFTIKVEVETTLKDVNVTEESFAVYVSGIDTYGEISSVSRSDVNIVMVVNPKIYQVLLISIPRDYYVQLHGTTGNKDKLTHAGIYGIDMSIQTIEDLLEVDINYYVKVNFTSVIDIVDALGGLEVYSEYNFISYSGYSFKEGLNIVNGEQALDFARTRKAFVDGDRQRGKNQQALIEAIIRKVTDKSIIAKYNSLLDAVNGKYQTNMSMKKITSLIKMQLNDMPSWTVTSYSLTGTDSYNYTYTYNQLLYAMEPDDESVTTAIKLINSVLNNEPLDSSYNSIGGNSNKVTQVQTTTPQMSQQENSDIEEPLEDDIEQDSTNLEEETSENFNSSDELIDNEENLEEENQEGNDNSGDLSLDSNLSEEEKLEVEEELDTIIPQSDSEN